MAIRSLPPHSIDDSATMHDSNSTDMIILYYNYVVRIWPHSPTSARFETGKWYFDAILDNVVSYLVLTYRRQPCMQSQHLQ